MNYIFSKTFNFFIIIFIYSEFLTNNIKIDVLNIF